METTEKYAVIYDIEYYQNDIQHPRAWEVGIEEIRFGEVCIGTLEQCSEWLEEIYDGRIYLNNGEAGKSYRIAKIVEEDSDFNSYIDSMDWNNCSFDDPKDEEEHQKNIDWKLTEIYNAKGYLYVSDPKGYYGYVVDLSEIKGI